MDEINRKTAAGGAQEGAFDPDELLKQNTQNLMMAVSSLPELQEQKKVSDFIVLLRLRTVSAVQMAMARLCQHTIMVWCLLW